MVELDDAVVELDDAVVELDDAVVELDDATELDDVVELTEELLLLALQAVQFGWVETIL